MDDGLDNVIVSCTVSITNGVLFPSWESIEEYICAQTKDKIFRKKFEAIYRIVKKQYEDSFSIDDYRDYEDGL